jgi:hypothetical protein
MVARTEKHCTVALGIPAKQLTRPMRRWSEVAGGRAGVARASGVPATDTHRRQTSFDLVGNHDNQELRHKQQAKEGKKAEKKNCTEEQVLHALVIRNISLINSWFKMKLDNN